MSETDEYVAAEANSRANGERVWQKSDGSASEIKDDDVAKTFHPHTSSIKLSGGSKLPDSRAPLWGESEAVQDNTTTSTVDYSSGNIPLVGVDESNNLAMFGGLSINEEYESDTSKLEHFVFTTNLIHFLKSSSRSGHVLVDGGHHTFGPTHALSCEDVAYYQRYLEGQGIQVYPIHTYGDGTLNDEWVEFENHADSAPNMDGFRVEDDAGHEYWFFDDFTITADGKCRLHTGDGTDDTQNGDVYWGSDTMIWNNSGDTVYLYDESDNLHDKKSY